MRSSRGVVAARRVLLASISLLCMTHGAFEPEAAGLSKYSFPEDFILGVSTAAFQIEGGWNEGGKGESMWDTYIHNNPKYTLDGSNGDIAADSYHKYMADVEIIKGLGVKYYRMSISWPRILPQGTDNHVSKDGVRYYRTLFEELIKANITPVVTLFHWDMPTIFMDLGGWANPTMVNYFEDYARVAFDHFGDVVKTWTTMNEPHQHCYNGYGKDYFVPRLVSHGIGDYLCAHNMLLAHSKVYHLYDRKYRSHQKGIIGITLDAFWADPRDPNKSEDVEAAERYLQMHVGLFAHPIYSKTGDYPQMVRDIVNNKSLEQGFTRSRLPYFTKQEIEELRGSSDFYGLNHYTTFLMSPSSMEKDWNVPSMDHDTGVLMSQNLTWPRPGGAADWFSVNPPGFRKLFNWLTHNYGTEVPIIVTENGLCDSGQIEDYERVDYYNNYLDQLLKAIYEDGCNIKGYFAWTLMDDFEWNDGYATKFGLFSVDFTDPERPRIPKLSALNYADIVRTRRLNFGKYSRRTDVYHANRIR